MNLSRNYILKLQNLPVFAVVFAMLALLAGCESTGSQVDDPFTAIRANQSTEAEKSVTIAKGMSKSEVLSLMGEPIEIQDVSKDDTIAEIWIYARSSVVSSTIEYDGEQERVFVDAATGELTTVREPIYRNEELRERIETQLLFNGDELVAFKENRQDGILKVGEGRH